MFVINSRQFPMNYGRTVSPGGITIQPYMAHGLGQLADPRVRTLDPGCPSSDSSIELLPGGTYSIRRLLAARLQWVCIPSFVFPKLFPQNEQGVVLKIEVHSAHISVGDSLLQPGQILFSSNTLTRLWTIPSRFIAFVTSSESTAEKSGIFVLL